jgi:hypothetical protein
MPAELAHALAGACKGLRGTRPWLEPSELAGRLIWVPLPFWRPEGWHPSPSSSCTWHRVYVPEVQPQVVAAAGAAAGSGGGGAAAAALSGKLSFDAFQQNAEAAWGGQRQKLRQLDWGRLIQQAASPDEPQPVWQRSPGPQQVAKGQEEERRRGLGLKDKGGGMPAAVEAGAPGAGASEGEEASDDEGEAPQRGGWAGEAWREAAAATRRGEYTDLKVLVG